MSSPFQKEGETHRQYLGDGVYAAFDGYQIWLRTERWNGMVHEIAIELPVMESLLQYADKIWRKKDDQVPRSDD